ncbi:MAG: endonuclease/exonuclease/phosphatase family protein [Clostridia bacterium]|nr:endonuclease/exonuclease/phosphatase family protein [Clostridia bacterium]
MRKKLLVFVLCFTLILPFVVSCNQQAEETETTDTSTDTSVVTQAELGEPNLRVLSFNVRMDLNPVSGGLLTGAAKNRIQAVREQILSYEPDVFGLQEDVNLWVDNINISNNSYSVYRPDVRMTVETDEYCSIYVRKGMVVKDSGWKWITSNATRDAVALTYAELTDGDGKYDMDIAELLNLGIINDATLKTRYVDSADNKNYGYTLAARLMNYVVLEVEGKTVIYVNTHFQHRGYDNKEYTAHPLYMLRYYERCAQYDMVKDEIEELKKTYADAHVIISGDFNDRSTSDFFKYVEKDFLDSMKIAKKGSKLEHSWNAAFKVDKQGQGYTYEHENAVSSRIDFCIVSESLRDRVAFYQVGSVKWTLALAEGTATQNVNVYPSDHLPVIVDFCIG